MNSMLMIAGLLTLLGGLSQAWRTRDLFRRGLAWRGSAVTSGAFVLLGIAVLSDLRSKVSSLYTAVVWMVAIAIWVGLWQRRREESRQSR